MGSGCVGLCMKAHLQTSLHSLGTGWLWEKLSLQD